MEQGQLNWIANFIWGIADDALRDLYVRGKYRDVIRPMTVLRRLDAVLEPTKQAVLDMKASLDKAGITNQAQALRQAAGQAFYNTSKFTLRDLKARILLPVADEIESGTYLQYDGACGTGRGRASLRARPSVAHHLASLACQTQEPGLGLAFGREPPPPAARPRCVRCCTPS